VRLREKEVEMTKEFRKNKQEKDELDYAGMRWWTEIIKKKVATKEWTENDGSAEMMMVSERKTKLEKKNYEVTTGKGKME
jgi:hypothetical protein